MTSILRHRQRDLKVDELLISFGQNGFAFDFNRPALECLEESAQHDANSSQYSESTSTLHKLFVTLRYVRPCTSLRDLEVFARINGEEYQAAWWMVRPKDAKAFFFTEHARTAFREPYFYGGTRRSDMGRQVPATPGCPFDTQPGPQSCIRNR